MDPAAPARLRPRPLLLSAHPLHQPRPRSDLARRHGERTGMVPRPLARFARHRRALRRADRALATRPLAHLPSAHPPHTLLGGDPDFPWPCRATAAGLTRGGHPNRPFVLRRGGLLYTCAPHVLGGESLGGLPPVAAPPHRLDSWLHRSPLLAAPAAVVPAELRGDSERLGPRSGARVARF